MIRKYNRADLSHLKKLIKNKHYWNFFKDAHYSKFIAIQDNRVVGVVVFSITLDTGNIDFIFVDEQYRSKNIGKTLIAEVEYFLKLKKADGLGVNCGIENKKAQKFYKREGFKKVGKVLNYFSNNNWQIFFWKKI